MSHKPTTPWSDLVENSSPKLNKVLKELNELPDPDTLVLQQTLATGIIAAFASDLLALVKEYPIMLVPVLVVLRDMAVQANHSVTRDFAEDRGISWQELIDKATRL